MDDLLVEQLRLFGYPREWLEFGLLDEEIFRAQIEAYRGGEDRNTEHYRFAAFRALLERAAFDDQLVERYLTLAERDPDPGMARAAVFEIMEHPGLTSEQLERVGRSPLCEARFLVRTQLLRALHEGSPTPELLQSCVDCREQRVHLTLLALPNLDRKLVRQLAENGATRAVRNQAAVRLNRR